MNTFSVGIAGSTAHTVLCAEALHQDERFHVEWVLTSPPQPVGRKHVVTANPLEQWAASQQIPVVHLEGKITPELKDQLPSVPDFLLVVDFGYLVPTWLLQLPRVSPINVHPSRLPRWRGSSPGQFVLLHGEKNSAVTIMIMDKGLDTGPILWQGDVEVAADWNQAQYYQESFVLAGTELPRVLDNLANGQLRSQPQPAESPTPIARRLEKADGYVSWTMLTTLIKMANVSNIPAEVPQQNSSLLEEVHQTTGHAWPRVIQHAVQGLSPWPGVWTMAPTGRGWKRMKILSVKVDETGEKFNLDQVQLEGQTSISWEQFGRP